MAEYTDEKEKMLHDYVVSTTEMLEQFKGAMDAQVEVSEELGARTDKLMEQHLELARVVQDLGNVVTEIAMGKIRGES